MPNNSGLLSYGAPLNSAFRSLGPSVFAKNQGPAQLAPPRPPELSDLYKQLYQNKELAALARYLGLGGF